MQPAAPTFSLDLTFPAIMGVVNVTPDSFSDGGRFLAADAALEQALTLVREGASIVDIGGESTRPGSETVSVDEELRRVLPVIEALAGSVGVPISVDTMKAEVARRADEQGYTLLVRLPWKNLHITPAVGGELLDIEIAALGIDGG